MRLLRAIAPGAFLLVGACASAPVYRTGGFPRERATAPPAAATPTAVEAAVQPWLGTPYRMGGRSGTGIDCSAFTGQVLAELGATLPRTVRAQRMKGAPVPAGELQAGDLVFFRLGSRNVNHVGVALDRHRFAHASTSRGVVVDRLDDAYFSPRFAEARRVLGEEAFR